MLSLWLSPFLLLSLPVLLGSGVCLAVRGRLSLASGWLCSETKKTSTPTTATAPFLPLPSLVPHQLTPSLRWNFDRLWRASGIPLCQAQCAGISLWTAGSTANWAAVTSSLRLDSRWNSSWPTRLYITQVWGVYGAIYFKAGLRCDDVRKEQ